MLAALLKAILFTAGCNAHLLRKSSSHVSWPATENYMTVTATATDPPPPKKKVRDGLADELVDQADPEFDEVSSGEGCISFKDFMNYVASHQPPPPPKYRDQWEEELRFQYEYADSMGYEHEPDGCVTEEEFDFANDMEGQPPVEEVAESAAEEPLAPQEGEPKMEEAEECPGQPKQPNLPTFKKFDENGDGAVSYKEVEVAADKEPGPPPPYYVVDAVKEFFDEDKSKSISLDEYCKAVEDFRTREGQMKFREIVTKNMMAAQRKSRAHECEALDVDPRDERISLKEAIDFVSDMEGTDMNVARVQEVFNAADADKDGFLTYDECSQAGKAYKGDGNEGPGVGKDEVLLVSSKNRTANGTGHTGSSPQNFAGIKAKLSHKSSGVPSKMQTHKSQKSQKSGWQFLKILWVKPRVMSHWHPLELWFKQTQKSASMHMFLHRLRLMEMHMKKVKANKVKKA